MKRLVKIKTRDKRYSTGNPYPFTPAQNEQGLYLTGQIIDPRNPETKDFLTLDEALGKRHIIVTGKQIGRAHV